MKPKFNKGDLVKVIGVDNASQFNETCHIKGVFRTDDWMWREYEVGDALETGFNPSDGLSPYAYPLFYGGELHGHVYEQKLRLIKKADKMKYELRKEFILEAYEAACYDWKERIRKEVPELFNAKLEVGKWHIGTVCFGSFINIKGFEWRGYYNRIECFGLTHGHSWRDDFEINNLNHEKSLRLATKEEIESILWKEANKRGLFEDTKIENSVNGNNTLLNCYSFAVCYNYQLDQLWNKNGVIYQKGIWATPLDKNKDIKDKIEKLQKELDELKSKVK